MRVLPVLLLVLLCATTSTAASVCVDGNTLAQYIGAGSCWVNAGSGVQVLFTFPALNALVYSSDPASTLTASQITVQKVTGPNNPEAGLRFNTSQFIAPNAPGAWADVNLTFTVSIYSQPGGYWFNSAHLFANHTLSNDPDAAMAAVESAPGTGLNLNLTDPADPLNLVYQVYPLESSLEPNINIFIGGAGSQVTSWTESFDLGSVPEPGTLAFIPGGLILIGLLRYKRYAKSVLPMLAMLALFAAKSHAVALCTDLNTINGAPTVATTLSIQKYITYTSNLSHLTCSMNDMLFHFNNDFTVVSAGGGTHASATSTQVAFTLIHPGNATDLIRLQYVPVATSTGASQSQTFSWSYTVKAPVYKITKMLGSTSTTPGVVRTTTITPGATPNPVIGLGPNMTLTNPLNTLITVKEKIAINAGPGIHHISNLTESFTEVVPEPITSLLMGSALLGMGLLGRKLRRK